MFEIIALLCIVCAIGLLIALALIDLRHWILPDELNLALGITGIIFHFATAYRFLDITQMLLGGALGAGMLYAIRFIANRHYGRDTLGLGDVKLLGAAGLWLGVDGIFQAVTIGALAGLVHGIAYAAHLAVKEKKKFTVAQLSIPAGPGFAVGITISGYILFHTYITETIHALLS